MVLCPWGDYNQVGSSVLRGKHQGTRVAGGGRAEEAIFSSLESSWSGGYLRVAEDGVGALGRVHGTGEVWLRGTGQGGRGAQVGEDRTVGGLETPRPAPHPTTSPPTGDAGQAPALSPVSSRNPRVAPCLLPHRPAEVRGRTLDHGSSESGSLDESHKREGSPGVGLWGLQWPLPLPLILSYLQGQQGRASTVLPVTARGRVGSLH